MPAATSPYQNNDYQAVSTYRPYQLPINDIFKASTALNQFWEMGAERVKSVYDNALGLNLVTDENRAVRDQFMQQAEKQLTKLSSMDLSDPSVQRQGIGIFSPLLKDENIIGEDYVVNHLSKELNLGQSFRTRDDGKGYNPLSIENLQYEKSFLNGPLNKRDGWKSLYQNLSTYTPNYDTAAEMKKITDVVKANELKQAKLDGKDWYITEINQKGISKDKILAAIEEFGSPQLKAQMRVEGRNTYYKHLASNPLGADGYFQGVASNLMGSKIADLRSQKAELEYQNYLIPEDKDNKTKKDAFVSAINTIQKSITDLETNQLPKFVAEFTGLGDLNKLSSNLSKVEQLWQSASMHQMAPVLAWESSSQEIKPNSAKIAQENLALAYERLNQGYAELGEDVRWHNMQYQADLLKNTSKGTTTGTGDDLFGGSSGGDGTSSLSVPGVMNDPSKRKILEKARAEAIQKLENHDENVRESAISNLLGGNSWISIQKNIQDSRPIGVNKALTTNEIDAAAKYFKAFSDKFAGKNVPGVYVSTGSEEDFKRSIEKMDVGTFKRMMGNMSKYDTEFTSEIIGKLAKEKGEDKAASFKATINKNLRDQTNFNEQILTEQVPALGPLANLFDNGGSVALTDEAIKKAWLRGQNSPLLKVSRRAGTVYGLHPGMDYTPYATSGGDSPMSLEEFTKVVRERTDPIFFKTVAEFNPRMKTYTFGEGKDEDPQKLQKLQRLKNIVTSANTEVHKDVSKVLDFISSREKQVKGYNLYSPAAGESLPSVEIIMEPTSKEDKEEWESIKNVRIPVVTANKEWQMKGNPSGNFRYRGALLAVTPVNTAEKGSITITNESVDAGRIDPIVNVKDVYAIVNGEKRPITPDEVTIMLRNQFGKMPLGTILETYPDEVNTFLAAFAIRVELANKEAKEKLKK